jgi:hypothetical protein
VLKILKGVSSGNIFRFRNHISTLPQPNFGDSATKIRHASATKKRRFRTQKKTIPQPKKRRFRNQKKRFRNPKKRISQPKKNNFATTIRATQKVHMHPVIKNALPNSFGVTKGYWSGLGPFKIGSFQQHDRTANIYPEMTTICGSMAPHVEEVIPMSFAISVWDKD